MYDEKQIVTEEFVSIYNGIIWRILQFSGHCRFIIKNNRIMDKSLKEIIMGTVSIIITNLIAGHVLYTFKDLGYLYIEEILLMIQINVTCSFCLLNMTYSDSHIVSKVLKRFIDIDTVLGSNDTKFMRDIIKRANTCATMFILFFQLIVVIGLNIAFVADLSLRISSGIYFFMGFFVLYDMVFLVTLYLNICLKLRYMNTALMKIGNVKLEYLPRIFLFDGVFWKKEFESKVLFQNKADTKDYTTVFKMIFDQLRRIHHIYRSTLLMSTICVVVYSLIIVHTYVKYAKPEDMPTARKICIFSLLIVSWLYLMVASQQSDLALRHIEQTKVICVYAQLKPQNSVKVFNLTRSILKMSEFREKRPSVCGLFYLDTGMVLRIAASIFVYITVLLQSGLSSSKNIETYKNIEYSNITH